jgi:hypothetical protein
MTTVNFRLLPSLHDGRTESILKTKITEENIAAPQFRISIMIGRVVKIDLWVGIET